MSSIRCHLFFILLIFSVNVLAQKEGNILIVSSEDAILYIDGDEVQSLEKDKPFKSSIEIGEHVIQVISKTDFIEKSKTLTVESGLLKVLKFDFSENTGDELLKALHVAALDFTIPGIVSIDGNGNYNPTIFYYAFEKGDQLLLNAQMKNRKGSNVLKIFSYPEEILIYQNNAFRDLENVKINIDKRSIYRFEFFTNHTFDRKLHFEVERIPENPSTKNFNTAIIDRFVYKTKPLVNKEVFSINSGFNSTFQGGQSRLLIPLTFPANTIKFYYRYSASKDKEDIGRQRYSYNLASELSSLMGPKSELIPSGTDLLNPALGSDVCDIFLLDYQNQSLFTSYNPFSFIMEGTRENFTSGIVEVNCCTAEPYFLGIANPDETDAIEVIIEVVAIVEQAELRMQEN